MTTLPAGPSLDRALVEAAMGGFCADPEEHTETGEARYWLKDGRVLKGTAWKWDVPGAPLHGKWSRQWETWSPSTNIAHAWEVVERMRSRGFITITDCGDHWDVVHQAGSCAIPIGSRNKSFPLAVCGMAMAAMKAAP